MTSPWANGWSSEAALGQGVIQNLLLDRAFLDGARLTLLWHHGTHVTVSLRENMDVLSDMLGLARLGETEARSL